ncbi:hypothetical protein COCNU_03G009070 [Cocos nucifera]|uniref:Uncharacterized protein n=1 Tax=Cocos nucifera TaxID=13894 RepID=A0A8K0I2X2_COCNU|nr:hypothetical protein COCNU_03G009070 [Cocos nucifera]
MLPVLAAASLSLPPRLPPTPPSKADHSAQTRHRLRLPASRCPRSRVLPVPHPPCSTPPVTSSWRLLGSAVPRIDRPPPSSRSIPAPPGAPSTASSLTIALFNLAAVYKQIAVYLSADQSFPTGLKQACNSS